MKILLLGSGGREHALADALARENTTIDLVAGPGNPGIAQLARVVSVDASDPIEVAELAEREQVKLRCGQETEFCGQELGEDRQEKEQRTQDPYGGLESVALAGRDELIGAEARRGLGTTRL